MTQQHESSIAILGAGSWGTALAIHLAKIGRSVTLWGRNAQHLADMQRTRCNERYLPRQEIPHNVYCTHHVEEAIQGSSEIICMMPSRTFAEFLELVAPYYQQQVIMWGCKGLLKGHSSLFFHDAVREKLGPQVPVVALSGPSFAQELANSMPTAVVLASDQQAVLQQVLPRIHGGSLRCYVSSDIQEVQLCGTYKNILAVAAGISDGLGLGANARSALITRGLAEILRLAEHMQLNQQAFVGLAGLGDMILSSTSDLSRNRRLGLHLGQGLTVEEAQKAMGISTVESLSNVNTLLELASQCQVELPIAQQVEQVLSGAAVPQEALVQLLARDPKAEV